MTDNANEFKVIEALTDVLDSVVLWDTLTHMLINGTEEQRKSARQQMEKWLEENSMEDDACYTS